MSSENTEPKQDDNASSPLSADAQIAAHRSQHQQKLKKIIMIASVFLLVAVGAFGAMQAFTNPKAAPQNTQNLQELASLSQAEADQYRETFKQALTQYEINTQPDIDKILLTDWETEKATELALLKERTLGAFAQGAFLQANQLFDKLKKDSDILVEKWQIQTAEYLALASKAFNEDQIPLAQLNLNKALALMPTNRSAMALQTRIDAHAEVAGLLSDLEVAKIENNLPKQIDLLSGIIELDPQRSELNEDLEAVQSTYEQQQLAKLLQDAETALNANKLDEAQKWVKQAQKIKPRSQGAKELNNKIAQARASKSLGQTKQDLVALKAQDEWEQVARISANSLKQHPNDEQLQTFQQQAQNVLNAKKSLQVFVSRPERIADENIRIAASKAVQNAFAAASMSPSLQNQIQQVAKSIDEYSEPVKVTVNSDNNTYIIVLGVGHVGQHTQKVIELMPGEYVLQGRREGYRNKRLSFTVKANTPMSLRLICDEKL